MISSRINNSTCRTAKQQSSSSNVHTPAIVSVLRALLGLPSQSSSVMFVRLSLNRRIHFLKVCTDYTITIHFINFAVDVARRPCGISYIHLSYYASYCNVGRTYYQLSHGYRTDARAILHGSPLETLSVFSNNTTPNFFIFWPQLGNLLPRQPL